MRPSPFALLLALPLSLGLPAAADADENPAALSVPAPSRRQELIRLVRQDCGACHGMTLKGGLGLPLLPENLRGKPVEGLVATVMQGRPGTAMPAWKSILNETDAEWIVRQLMAGFPQE